MHTHTHTHQPIEFFAGHVPGSLSFSLGGAGGAVVGAEDGNFAIWVLCTCMYCMLMCIICIICIYVHVSTMLHTCISVHVYVHVCMYMYEQCTLCTYSMCNI